MQGLYHTLYNVPWGDCYLKAFTIKKGIMKTTKKSMCALYEKHMSQKIGQNPSV